MRIKDLKRNKYYAISISSYGRRPRRVCVVEGFPQNFKPYLERGKFLRVEESTTQKWDNVKGQYVPYVQRYLIFSLEYKARHSKRMKPNTYTKRLTTANVIAPWEVYEEQLKKYNKAVAQQNAKDKAEREKTNRDWTIRLNKLRRAVGDTGDDLYYQKHLSSEGAFIPVDFFDKLIDVLEKASLTKKSMPKKKKHVPIKA